MSNFDNLITLVIFAIGIVGLYRWVSYDISKEDRKLRSRW